MMREGIVASVAHWTSPAKRRKHPSMKRKLTRIIQKRGQWYIAYVKEIPGVNTQGRTVAEAQENLKEAVKLILETNRSLRPH
jgi:predicted RNase H-like HicB family nuclease